MAKSNKRQDVIRAPVQARSQQRVEQILNACKTLIFEHGCAGLKMSDIASTAGISIASIYQYYPNKQAIIAALATHYLEVFRLHAYKALEESPDNLDALWKITMQLADDYYRLHREDPVVRDIWMGSSTDKTLRDLADQDSEQHLEIYFERSKHLFKPSKHKQVKEALSLIIDFMKVTLQKAVELDDEAGKQKMKVAKELVSSSWEGVIRPLARASKKR